MKYVVYVVHIMKYVVYVVHIMKYVVYVVHIMKYVVYVVHIMKYRWQWTWYLCTSLQEGVWSTQRTQFYCLCSKRQALHHLFSILKSVLQA